MRGSLSEQLQQLQSHLMSKTVLLLVLLLLLLLQPQPQAASTISGPSAQCSCTPRDTSSSAYISQLNAYTASMRALINDINTQLQSLGLKLTDFPPATLSRLLQATSSANDATGVVNDLLQTINSNASSSTAATAATTTAAAVTSAGCTSTSTSLFYGASAESTFGSGGNFSSDESQWRLQLSTAALVFDFGINGCSNDTQYVEQICIDGNPSQVYIFVQPDAASGAQLLASSLTTSTQSGQLCISVRRQLLAFSILPKSLKLPFGGSTFYLFRLSVTGCFSSISSACLPVSTSAVTTTTAAPCVGGNAMAESTILPNNFVYFAQLTRINGYVINATLENGVKVASGVLMVDLTAGGCRPPPNITQVCAAGNFRRMRIGRITAADGTITPFAGSTNVSATAAYQRFCYNPGSTMSLFALEPAELFNSADTEFRMFPEIWGCYQPTTNSCVVQHACTGPHIISADTDALPARALTASGMAFSSGQWVAAASGAQLLIDITVAGCRNPAPVTLFCVVSTNATSARVETIFANADFTSDSTLNTNSLPACVQFVNVLWVRSIRLTLFSPGTSSSVATIGIQGCFEISTAISSCGRATTTTTAAAVTLTTTTATPTTTAARPAETCQSQMLTSSLASIPSVAISGASFSSASNLWSVAFGGSLLVDLTAKACRSSVELRQVCILSNAAAIKVDYVREDNSRISTSGNQPAAGAAQCFSYSSVRAKSLIVQPQSLKSASSGDTAYTLQVNISACYSAILSSCYSPVCACSSGYRPVFTVKRYFSIQFTITSGAYSVFNSALTSSITSEFRDWSAMTDSMIGNNFLEFSDDYEAIDQITFGSGSVTLSGRLIMRNDTFTAQQLDAALTSGLTANTSGGAYVVNADSIVITDISTTTTTTTTATTTTSNATTTALSTATTNTALLIGLLIPLILLFILFIVLLILLCKYCHCCCFSKTNSTSDQGTLTSPRDTDAPKSAREEKYVTEGEGLKTSSSAPTGSKKSAASEADSDPQPKPRRRRRRRSKVAGMDAEEDTERKKEGEKREGGEEGEEDGVDEGKKEVGAGLKLPEYPRGTATSEQRRITAEQRLAARLSGEFFEADGEAGPAGVVGDGEEKWATRRQQAVSDDGGDANDDESQQQMQLKFHKRSMPSRPNTPRTHSIETVTYQIADRQIAWAEHSEQQ